MLEVLRLVLGMVETNTYLAADASSGEAVVIDPAWEGESIARAAVERGWHVRQIWLTHAHFDHLGGVVGLVKELTPAPQVALHAADLPLWQAKGGAALFGMHIDPGPKPAILLEDGTALQIGAIKLEVRHAPGHTPGHVVFYAPDEALVFCGDLIFAGGIGRTDLPGGDYRTIIASIHNQILSLPDETRLLSGHGEETTVGEERRYNPFLTTYAIR